MDMEKVIAWLTEISLRPCDFTRDDFDAYETEQLANEALEICDDAKVFNQQRNDALALLKEQEAVKPVPPEDEFSLYRCGKCYHLLFRCVDKYCSRCGKAVKWE